MERTTLTAALLFLTACSSSNNDIHFVDGAQGFKATGAQGAGALLAETTPIVWNGALLFVYGDRPHNSAPGEVARVTVADEAGAIVALGPSNFAFTSALVHGGRLYVFGVTDWSKPNALRMSSTADLTTWSEPVTLLAPKQGTVYYNSSVAEVPGGFVMAYEVCETARPCFTWRTALSTDLESWFAHSERFSDHYAACPTIRYLNGYYYAFYLVKSGGQFVTAVSRSLDRKSWERSSTSVMSPATVDAESTNVSDVDFVEYNGKLEVVFINGDQTTWGESRRATFDGSLADLVAKLFK
jgi:hypothetical protein